MTAVQLYYYTSVPNMGDLLNPILLRGLFGLESHRCGPETCELSAIGSLMEQFLWRGRSNIKRLVKMRLRPRLTVWGSGFVAEAGAAIDRPPAQPERFSRRIDFRALRGKLSRQRAELILGRPLPKVALGDPGLLASHLLRDRPAKSYRLGIIPHYVDKQDPRFDEIVASIPHARKIDIQGDVMSVIEAIASCEVVLSTAMHGLIVADSLGVPNRWCTCSGQLTGGDYKFRDYYSAFGLDAPSPIDLTHAVVDQDVLRRVEAEYPVGEEAVQRIQADLLDAFPSDLRHRS